MRVIICFILLIKIETFRYQVILFYIMLDPDEIEHLIVNVFDEEQIFADVTFNGINIEPDAILRNRGYLSGNYRLQLNVLRKKVLNTTSPSFVIKDISPSRRELKITTPSTPNSVLDRAASIYISELESSIYYRQFELNFGSDNLIPGINLLLDINQSLKNYDR